MTDLDPLAELEEVACRRCGHGYRAHEAGGGHCRGVLGGWSSPAAGLPCMCPGMRWIDPDGPSVGSYADPPQPPKS